MTSDFMLTRVDDHLVLTSTTNKASSLNVPLYLRDDGVFAVPGHSGAWFSKRDGKTFLTVAYCSMFAVYELVPT